MESGYRIIAMMSNDWKIPLNMAIGIHVLILLGGLYLPGLFKAKPKFADIYTVSIINIAEPAAETPQPQTKPVQESSPPKIVKPAKAKSIAPIAEPQPKPAVSPKKSISLKPLKRKRIKKVVKDDSRQKAFDRKRREKLARALREEELLAEKARLAREALEAERQLLKPQQRSTDDRVATQPSVSRRSTPTPRRGAAGGSNLLVNQLNAAIKNRLSQYWSLPDYLQQNSELSAVAVITINRDGSIANMFFENRSGNRVFDQLVKKTIEAVDPFPPIPPALKKQRYEIGLVFKPGGIGGIQ